MSLQLSINHQNDPDLTAVLIAPDGTTVQLFSGVGTTGAARTRTSEHHLRRRGDGPDPARGHHPVTGIGAGPFNPQFPLSTFNNHGSWATGRCKSTATRPPSTARGQLELDAQELRARLRAGGAGQRPVSPARSASSRRTRPPGGAAVLDRGRRSFAQRRRRGSGRIGGLAVGPLGSVGQHRLRGRRPAAASGRPPTS